MSKNNRITAVTSSTTRTHGTSFSVIGVGRHVLSENEQVLIGIALHLDAADPLMREADESMQSYASRIAGELVARVVQHKAWLQQVRALGREDDPS